MLAVGEAKLGRGEDSMLKMTTGFSGGIGCTHRDMCGALSAGLMVVGALYGRTEPHVDDALCMKISTRYRDAFMREFGSLTCHELRAERFGSQGWESCSVLVERASRVLLEILTGVEAGPDGENPK